MEEIERYPREHTLQPEPTKFDNFLETFFAIIKFFFGISILGIITIIIFVVIKWALGIIF